MKNNAKLIILMLCIGLSATINVSASLNGMRFDPYNALLTYNKAAAMDEGIFSKEGATANWAKITAEPLSDDERIALAYECLSAPANKNANAAWGRTASILAGAAARGVGAK